MSCELGRCWAESTPGPSCRLGGAPRRAFAAAATLGATGTGRTRVLVRRRALLSRVLLRGHLTAADGKGVDDVGTVREDHRARCGVVTWTESGAGRAGRGDVAACG